MNPRTTKVKNGRIVLPKDLQKSWEEADVFVTGEKDTILIKRLSVPSLTLKEMMDEFSKAARKTRLSKKEADKALKEVRKELYK